MNNPLAQLDSLPPFSRIRPDHVEPAIDQLLTENRQRIEQLLASRDLSWDSLIDPLEQLSHRLHRTWSPVSHLNSVCNEEQLRETYNRCLPKLSDYETELRQNEKLYQACMDVRDNEEDLDPVQQRLIELSLRNFRLAGVALEAGKKSRFRELMQELSTLQTRFEENVLDATSAWSCHITDKTWLGGIPERALARAAAEAQSRELDGWVFTLDYPSYSAIMTYADSRPLRKKMYTAWVTRASDQGPHAGQWDNSDTIDRILACRHEAAGLLGYTNFAEYSLATKMAESVEQVARFLRDLAEHSYATAEDEYEELEHFAGHRVKAWDVAYYSEKLRREKFSISDEELRPYFPITRVMQGMFTVVEKLYDITVREVEDIDVWHPDVRFYEVIRSDGSLQGAFYTDLYARSAKRGGAWMDDCIGRTRSNGSVINPVAYLSCNFMPAVGDTQALLTHDEVVTLFHEFGHVLHHILTGVDYPSVAGINGVAWDAVEVPSQFMENFCWFEQILPLISGHHETNEPLPKEIFGRLLDSRSFQTGLNMMRQIEYALFDLRIHAEYDPDLPDQVGAILAEVREETAVLPTPKFNRFAHAFSHVFGGGYAAGYYSYKWAEVLSADAFSAFEESGVLDRATGRRFLDAILQRGGGIDPMQAFVDFRGRRPRIDALLRYSGIGE